MPTKTIEKRVNDLEIAMTSLSVLPARVTSLDTQIVHLRDEMRAGFSAMRGELHTELIGLRDELRTELRTELDGLRGELNGLRDELRTGPERMATWSETRVMYEDLIERIKLLGEGIRAAVTGSSLAGPAPVPETTPMPATVDTPIRRRPPRKRR